MRKAVYDGTAVYQVVADGHVVDDMPSEVEARLDSRMKLVACANWPGLEDASSDGALDS